LLPVPASIRLWALPAVCLDQALDELVDVASLGKVPLGQQVAELGLGQAFVARAGPCVDLPGVLALGLAGLAGQLLLGLLGLLVGGPLGLLRLLALGLAGLAGQLLFGLLGLLGLLVGGPLGVLRLLAGDVTGRLGLSRTTSPADSAFSRTVPDSVAAASAHLTTRRRLMSTVRCTRSK